MNSPDFGCLYLHGFLSSPQSGKAQQTLDYFRQHYSPEQLLIPQLPFAPADAAELMQESLRELQQKYARVMVIGSSLGGYYATWLSQQYGIDAALINPAVRPFDLFEHYLGPNEHYYSGEVHELTEVHIEQLRALYCEYINDPERLLLLLQTADETLDYRLAAAYYRQCPGWLEAGGDHSFQCYPQRLPMIMQWAARHLSES